VSHIWNVIRHTQNTVAEHEWRLTLCKHSENGSRDIFKLTTFIACSTFNIKKLVGPNETMRPEVSEKKWAPSCYQKFYGNKLMSTANNICHALCATPTLGSLPYRTATKSILICFHSMQIVWGKTTESDCHPNPTFSPRLTVSWSH